MKNFARHPLVLLLSFLIFGASIYAIFTFNSPAKRLRLPTIKGAKSGVLTLETPETIYVNQPFTMKVTLNTQGNYVNAAGIYLHFEPQKFQVLTMDTSGSFCQFYPEKRFDNNIGTISLACGSPHPGVRGENPVLTLQFLPTVIGNSVIRTSNQSKLLVSDGKGTNILTEYPAVPINVAASF
jgi:hypothetical protein